MHINEDYFLEYKTKGRKDEIHDNDFFSSFDMILQSGEIIWKYDGHQRTEINNMNIWFILLYIISYLSLWNYHLRRVNYGTLIYMRKDNWKSSRYIFMQNLWVIFFHYWKKYIFLDLVHIGIYANQMWWFLEKEVCTFTFLDDIWCTLTFIWWDRKIDISNMFKCCKAIVENQIKESV